jgi:hypothetical protein
MLRNVPKERKFRESATDHVNQAIKSNIGADLNIIKDFVTWINSGTPIFDANNFL